MAAEARTEATPPKGAKSGPARPGITRRRLQLRTLRDRALAVVVATGGVVALGGALLLGRATLAVRDLESNQYAGMASETRIRFERMANRDRVRLIEAAYSDPFYEQVGRGPAAPDSMIRPSFGERFPAQFGDRFIAVYDLAGKALYRWADESLPNVEPLVATNALFRMLDNREPTIGLIRNGNDLYWVGGAPVLPTNFTDQSQPIRGYVVVAKRFPAAAVAPGSGDRAARLELTALVGSGSPLQTRVDGGASRDSVRVTFSLPDILARQTTLATLTTGRGEYRTIESTLRWLMLAALLGAAGIAVTLFVVAGRWLVAPVSRLAAAMVPSQNSPFPSLIGSVSTAKEWNRLTSAINRLLTHNRGSQERLDRLTGVTGDGAFERDLASGELTLTPRFRHLLGLSGQEPQPIAALGEKLAADDAAAALLAWLVADLPEPRIVTLDVGLRANPATRLRFEASVTTDAGGAPNRIVGRVLDLGPELAARETLAKAVDERETARAARGRFLTAIADAWPIDPVRRTETVEYLKTIGSGLEGSLRATPEPFNLYALLQSLSTIEPGADVQIVPGVPERVLGDPGLLRQALVALLGTTDRLTRAVLRANQPGRLQPNQVRISVEDRRAVTTAEASAIGLALETGETDGSEASLGWPAVHFLAAALGGTAGFSLDGDLAIRSVVLPLAEVPASTRPDSEPTDPGIADPMAWTDTPDATFEAPETASGRSTPPDQTFQLVADATVTIDLDRTTAGPGAPLGDQFAAALAAGTDDALRSARIALDEVPARLSQLRGGIQAGEASTAVENAVAVDRVAALLGATDLARYCRDLIEAAEQSYLDTAGHLLAGLESSWARTADALRPSTPAPAPVTEPAAIDPATLEQLTASLGEGGLGAQLVTLFLAEAPGRIEAIERAARSGNIAEIGAVADDLKGICGLVGAEPMARLCDLVRSADGIGAEAATGTLRTEWERTQRVLDQLMSARIGA